MADRACSLHDTTTDGSTALHLAADNGNLEATRWLIHQRVDIKAKNDNGQTAFDLAVEAHYKEVSDVLQPKANNVRLQLFGLSVA